MHAIPWGGGVGWGGVPLQALSASESLRWNLTLGEKKTLPHQGMNWTCVSTAPGISVQHCMNWAIFDNEKCILFWSPPPPPPPTHTSPFIISVVTPAFAPPLPPHTPLATSPSSSCSESCSSKQLHCDVLIFFFLFFLFAGCGMMELLTLSTHALS